jgi:hypothetical protein
MFLCRIPTGRPPQNYAVADVTVATYGPSPTRMHTEKRQAVAWRYRNGVAAVDETPDLARARALQLLYSDAMDLVTR